MEENYIVQLREKLYQLAKKRGLKMDLQLLDFYILIALLVGKEATNENVHDAWALWQNDKDPVHYSLKPFKELSKDVQLLDTPYRDLIIEFASKLTP